MADFVAEFSPENNMLTEEGNVRGTDQTQEVTGHYMLMARKIPEVLA